MSRKLSRKRSRNQGCAVVCVLGSLVIGAGACRDNTRGAPQGGFSKPFFGAGFSPGSEGGVDDAGGAGGTGGTAGVGGLGGLGGVGGVGGMGGGVAECDDSGFCDTCAQCAIQSECANEENACNGEVACTRAKECLRQCNLTCLAEPACYQTCRDVCEQDEPGFADAVDAVACWCAATCQNDCSPYTTTDCMAFAP